MTKTLSTRRRDFDLLRVCSMAAVVYLHTAAGALRQSPDTALWHFSNVFASLGTAAVPLFFMLSGSLLMSSEKTADPAYVLRRRVPRVLVPGLAWSLLIIAFIWVREGGAAALSKLLALPYTTVLTPYWFLYALVPMYLLSPLLKRMVDNLERRHWNYLMGLWVLVTLGLHTLRFFIPEPWNGLVTENMTLGVSLLEGYLGYFLLGPWLDGIRKLPSRGLLWAVFLADWAVIALGTWGMTSAKGWYGEWFSSYQGLFAMVLAASIFLLVKSCCGRGRGSGRLLVLLSSCSFGVYLAHPLAIKVVEWAWVRLTGGPSTGIPSQVCIWIAALAACVLGVVLVSSVKPLCYLVTGQTFSTACAESNLFSLFRRR